MYFDRSGQVAEQDLLLVQGLYDVLHLNFVHSISQQLMEQLAGGLVKANAAQRIAKVHDMYMSFSTLEAGLFCLNLPEAYRHINEPSASEAQIEVRVACHSSVWHGLRSPLLVGYNGSDTTPCLACMECLVQLQNLIP